MGSSGAGALAARTAHLGAASAASRDAPGGFRHPRPRRRAKRVRRARLASEMQGGEAGRTAPQRGGRRRARPQRGCRRRGRVAPLAAAKRVTTGGGLVLGKPRAVRSVSGAQSPRGCRTREARTTPRRRHRPVTPPRRSNFLAPAAAPAYSKMLLKVAAAAMMLLAGSALAEPQKAAPPCPKVEFTAADVVSGSTPRARCMHQAPAPDTHR